VHLINFSVPFAINILVLLLYGIPFTWLSLLFPLTLIPLLLLGVGIGLFVSMLRVVGEDFSRIIDQFIGFLMFLTPIIYAPKVQISWLAGIVAYNPLTYLIGFSRDVLVNGTFTHPTIYLVTSAVSIAFFLFAVRVFMRSERKLLERLINV
jgi:lipopolysaccharide transport system permease protein